jgi:hypothetical protein
MSGLDLSKIPSAIPYVGGGAAVFFLADFLPGKWSVAGKIAGVLAALYGASKVLFSGSVISGIDPQSPGLPVGSDVPGLSAQMLAPMNGGSVDTGYDFKYVARFQLSSPSSGPVTLEWRVTYTDTAGTTKITRSYPFTVTVPAGEFGVDEYFNLPSGIWKYGSGTLYVGGRRLTGSAFEIKYP